MSNKIQSKKKEKDQTYKNLLNQLDLKIDTQNQQEIIQQKRQDLNQINDNQSISVQDLLKRLENNHEKQQETTGLSQSLNYQQLKKQQEDVEKKTKLLQEPDSLIKQEVAERKANYKLVKENIVKWLPIVKRNREADQIDFTDKTPRDILRLNSLQNSELQKNEFAQKIQGKLNELSLGNEKVLKKKEQQILDKLDPQEAQSKLNQIIQKKNLSFYSEVRNKRIAKIKSKLYHKIKKRKTVKEQMKQLQSLDPSIRKEELENLRKKRAEERVSQKHQTKSKSMRNLLRYGDKVAVQQTINDVNNMRREIVKKVQQYETNGIDEESSEYDDENYRDQAIKDLENQILQNDEQPEEQKTGLKFIDQQREQKNQSAIEEAKKLIHRLNEKDDNDILSEQDMISDDEDRDKKQKQIQEKQQEQKEEKFSGRKTYQTKDGKQEMEIEINVNNNKQNVGQIMKSFIVEKDYQDEQKDQNKQNIHQNIIKIDAHGDNEQSLVSGINIKNLKKKYQKNQPTEFNKKDLEAFEIENKEELYKDLLNFNILIDDENQENFLNEKLKDYEEEIPQEQKALVGWGTWAGQGIAQKPEPSKEQLLKNKIQKIKDLKQTRIDGKLDHAIINEHRNKQVVQYLVKELPYPYNNKEQFNFVTNTALGSEWSTMRSQINMTKPKVLTRPGDIIKPIKLPKNELNKKIKNV